ncbi:MAG: GHKL domain-containing protein, partial [Firmicutes bacterium]|nr:GHKL domain-containing protein [Bacillota bacterium]
LPEGQRYIRLKSHYHRNNILISVENPYAHEPHFKDGLPQSDKPGHGYGVRSMSLLVKENNGQLLYTAENGLFRLQVMIPTAKYPPRNEKRRPYSRNY